MKWMRACLLGLCVPALALPLSAQSQNNLDFLTGLPDYRQVRSMLHDYLMLQAVRQLDERGKKVEQISTPEEVAKRRAYIREQMVKDLGGFPQMTPLNARVVGTLDRDGYKIDKVIFESQPNFYVTGNLYLPKSGHPPYPGVLFPLGHEEGGKSNADWQQTLGEMARRGYVGFAWDPVGQGERVQLYDADLEAGKIPASTAEHTDMGAQCLLLGDALARYTIWDGMRALDYLISRPEVDAQRIACTGNSGGGTHTAYLAALDDRIKVAMPSCYITSWKRLLESIGPQDAEQCLPPWIEQGLDHGDFIIAFSPKPYLILSAIRDFVSINGARETYAEAQHIYSVLGVPGHVSQFEADNGHGYSEPRRVAAYQWLDRWFKGKADESPEVPVAPASEEELRCTPSGQVNTSLGGETVFSLNEKRYGEIRPHRRQLITPQAVEEFREQIKDKVKQLAGYEHANVELNVKPFGTIQKDGYHIDKLTYRSEPGIDIPSLLFVPEGGQARMPAVLYVNSKGKSAGAAEIEAMVKGGMVVLAIDARGWGETGPNAEAGERGQLFPNYGVAMIAMLLGKTLVAMRAEDIQCGADLLASRAEVDAERIYGMGVGGGAVPLLHQAVFDNRLKKIILQEGLVSYGMAESYKIQRGIFESIIPGVLKEYDLPDLVAVLAPRPVWVIDATDPLGNRVAIEKVRSEYAEAMDAYKLSGAADALRIQVTEPADEFSATYRGLK